MATLILSAAGAAAGAALGGPFGGAASIAGRAVGAVAGAALDQAVLGAGAEAVATPPLERIRLMGSREGAPIPRVFGRMRVAGQVIWASPFRVETETRGGGKTGPLGPRAPAVTTRRYRVSLALALCEGPIERIGRLWADGALLPPGMVEIRLHRCAEDQASDPLIAALEGAQAPAYRGTAYLLIEDLALDRFGGRVPQFNVEVFRPAQAPEAARKAPPLGDLVRGVALIPGCGEFALETTPVRRRIGPGRSVTENRNTPDSRADLPVALDQLQAEAPACRSVSLVISWFGDDLRAGRCRVRPAVETREKETEPVRWSVGGMSRLEAAEVSKRDGRPVYGGTPSDASVVAAIRELKARGLSVMIYPFLLMDVAPGSGKADPYGAAEQAAFPWRGRITTEIAPGRSGTTDKTQAAAAEAAAFFGTARVADFDREGERVLWRGAEEWSWSRFVLHYAHLCAAAGGVDAFCIGSELRGLTQMRSGPEDYPGVEALRRIAREVRTVLPDAKLGYAADWSEYFGHRPEDGTGDVLFHLDPLWADPAIDFVGIDNYMPLADWREGRGRLDRALARSVYDLDYLKSQVEGGEGFDWFYASEEDRRAQRRTPIRDELQGENWVFRFKDLRGWWENRHHDRPGGARKATPTGWRPRSKPIWFTELGCPAVDLGANQPNVFHDPKSAESALPWFSVGAPDALMQRRFLQAALSYWEEEALNPISARYGGRMVDVSRTHVWAWDARPWPDFPAREEVWTDAANHRLGHWITGRLGAADLAETVAELCAAAGLAEADVSELEGAVEGYALERASTAREALQPLMLAYGFDAIEAEGRLSFRHRRDAAATTLEAERLVEAEEGALALVRAPSSDAPRAVRLGYVDADGEYEPAAVEAQAFEAGAARVEAAETPLALSEVEARGLSERWLAEATLAAEEARLTLPPSAAGLRPGDLIEGAGLPGTFRVDRIVEAEGLELVARRADPALHAPWPAPARARRAPPLLAREPLEIALIDAPASAGEPVMLLAAFAEPWEGAAVWAASSDEEAFAFVSALERPATIGELSLDAAAAAAHRWSGALQVRLFGGTLRTASARSTLDGANVAALGGDGEPWEIVQFQRAEPLGQGEWRLEGVLRGQAGTEPFMRRPTPAGARFVLLDEALTPLPADARRLRVGPAAAEHDDSSFTELMVGAPRAALRPWAPARLRVERSGGDVTLSWARRSRLDTDDWSGPDAPLAEPRERWRVTLTAAGRPLRRVEIDAPRWVYDAAAQAADGASGTVRAAVAMIGARYGDGPERMVEFEGIANDG
jgi:hypothetical protein